MDNNGGFSSITDLDVNRPVSFWNRKIEISPKEIFFNIGKMAIKGASFDFNGVGESALDIVSSAGLEMSTGETAWLLIYRSLESAIRHLVQKFSDLFTSSWRVDNSKLEEISEILEKRLSEITLTINADFFNKPDELSLVHEFQNPLAEWMVSMGMSESNASQICCRLPDYFIMALHEQWRDKPQEYAKISDHFNTPFTRATEETQGWQRYRLWLKQLISDRMFAETFGVEKIYVPLRAYHEVVERPDRVDRDRSLDLEPHNKKHEKLKRVVFDLEKDFTDWVINFSSDSLESSVRFISGGPGSGKSTFAKIFACHISRKTDIPTLFIPLHLFDAKANLIPAMETYIKENSFISINPLDAKSGRKRLLIIFDGLDELAMQGRAASEAANEFVDEVLRRISSGNSQGMKRQVIITGRTIAIQSVATKLRDPKQICHVLPYFFIDENQIYYDQEATIKYEDQFNLLRQDQRDIWWKQYGEATGRGYESIPEELKKETLQEITAQPLLNYLVALSYEREKIKFTDDTTLNQIYADMISGVYCRQYENNRVSECIGDLREEEFVRVLEEIALAMWHGNGRNATVSAIEAQCKTGGIQKYLNDFKEGAKSGVTRLLTAFYFRRSGGRIDGDPTFEFTHKSFGEYLTALRIVRLLKQIETQIERRERDPDDGWSEKEALEKWTEFCSPTPMDYDLKLFIDNELNMIDRETLRKYQRTVAGLLAYTINKGISFASMYLGRGFKEHLKLAKNAEIALLVVHCSTAEITMSCSDIPFSTDTLFGEWITRLIGQRIDGEISFVTDLLSYLNLSESYLYLINLEYANLQGVNLQKAYLQGSNLQKADLQKARLQQTYLQGADLQGANLQRANLQQAELEQANLQWAALEMANLQWAILQKADLRGVNLQDADLQWADLQQADLRRANLYGADLQGANLQKANLRGVDLREADLQQADLQQADLRRADLQGADLQGANLQRADLRRAKLGGTNLQEANMEGANTEDVIW